MTSRRDGLFLLVVCVCLLLTTALPYLVMWRNTPPGQVFGGLLVNVKDQNIYLMWMQQVADGRWQWVNLMDTRPAQPFFTSSFWIPLGLLSRLTGNLVAYHLTRVVFAVGFIVMLYKLLSKLLPAQLPRRMALLVIVFGGGIVPLFQRLGLKGVGPGPAGTGAAFVTELLTWPSLMAFGQFAAALLLLLAILYLLVRVAEEPARWRYYALLAAAIHALLASFHPYDVVTVSAIIGVYALMTWQAGRPVAPLVRFGVVTVIPGMLVFLMQVAMIVSTPTGRIWNAENAAMPSPSPLAVAIMIGLPAVLAFVDHRRLLHWRELSPAGLLPAAWIIATLFVAYTDTIIPFERRLLMGLQIPLVVLAVQVWQEQVGPAWNRLRERHRQSRVSPVVLWATLLVAVLPQTVSEIITDARPSPSHEEYHSRDLLAVAAHLRQDAGARVLCGSDLGQWLPQLCGRQVYAGALGLSPNLPARDAAVRQLLDPRTPERWRRDFLRAANCSYLLAPTRAKDALWGLQTQGALRQELALRDLALYRITPTGSAGGGQ